MVRLIASSNALGGEALLSPNNVFLSMTCAVGLNISYGFGTDKFTMPPATRMVDRNLKPLLLST